VKFHIHGNPAKAPAVENWSQISHFLTPVKLGEGGRNVWVNLTSLTYDQLYFLSGRGSAVWEIKEWVSKNKEHEQNMEAFQISRAALLKLKQWTLKLRQWAKINAISRYWRAFKNCYLTVKLLLKRLTMVTFRGVLIFKEGITINMHEPKK